MRKGRSSHSGRDGTRAAAGAPSGFLEWLGPGTKRRSSVRIGATLGGTGGLLAGIGVVLIGADSAKSSDSGTVGAILCVALLAAGLVALARGSLPVCTAGAATGAGAVIAFCVFAFAIGSSTPKDAIREILVIATLVWAALYLFAPDRARALFLALALVGIWAFVVYQVGLQQIFGGFSLRGDGVHAISERVSSASLVVALVYLLLGRLLDLRERSVMASPFTAVSIPAFITGSVGLGFTKSVALAGFIGLVAGLALVVVCGHGRRRATTWWGALGVGAGLGAIVQDWFGSSLSGSGLALLVLGVAAAAGAHFVAGTLYEPDATVPDSEDGNPAPSAQVFEAPV